MTELKNIELDLLFRIDFFALTNFGEDGYTDDKKFEKEKEDLKNNFGFKDYFQREIQGYDYVRLSDIEKDTRPYIEYLKQLENKDIFNCCQLEQAIGVFQSGKLIAFLSTDTGICYDSPSHFKAIENFLNSEDTGFLDINTFFGKNNGQYFELYYSPRSNNVDSDNLDDTISFKIKTTIFQTEIVKLKHKTNKFFREFKTELNSKLITDEKKKFAGELLVEIK
jgi:hypothetical protein